MEVTATTPASQRLPPSKAPRADLGAFASVELGLPPVITRMSELPLRTLRDDPADAEVASHNC